MNLTEFGWALNGRLVFPIMRELTTRSAPQTAAQVTRLVNESAHSEPEREEKASEEGIRRALNRMVSHGLVLSEPVGGRTVYRLNRSHLFHHELTKMVFFDRYLIGKMRKEISAWDVAPVSAVLFGSAARRSGDELSDIDLLLVHPVSAHAAVSKRWAEDVHALREKVLGWTGNHLVALEWSEKTLRMKATRNEPIVASIRKDGRLVGGVPLSKLLEDN